MYAMTEKALQMINGQSFVTPPDLLDMLYPEVYEFGKKITSNPELRKTFALNALVGLDNAAWLLYAKENGIVESTRGSAAGSLVSYVLGITTVDPIRFKRKI